MKKLFQEKFFNQKFWKYPEFYNKFYNLLKKVNKPARYIGFEPYSYHKLDDNNIYNDDKKLYRIALTYPDLYEIAMSNLTIKYFYYFINKEPEFYCERFFLPDIDLNRLLIEEDIPLLSLETWSPISNFDIWAFTLQTELTYTNILYILKLAKLKPLLINRKKDDPIIIIGGVSVFNPLPLAPFVDLFFIGEGEEAILEAIKLDKKNKENGLNKEERIKGLLEIEGFFSFSEQIKNYYSLFLQENSINIDNNKNQIFNGNDIIIENIEDLSKIRFIEFLKFLKDKIKIPDVKNIKTKRRIIKDLNDIKYPIENFLPLVQPVQDRISIEVSRGCLNGCRFCQASFVYRPYREKDASQVAIFAVESVLATGFEECNLSSLSISDYSNIFQLMKALERYFNQKHISLSVPSLRVASFNIDLFNSLKSVRKSGLTFAVEAGCQDIRNKINKEFNEDKFFDILKNLYDKGWNLVKLYFIIGFPEIENEEDKLIGFLNKIKENFPKLYVNVSIALLIPKPYTPFMFDQQLSIDSFLLKVNKIKKNFKNSRISIKYHDPYSSYLEYYYANGAFDSSYILGLAYAQNISFDAWDEKKNKEFYDNLNLYGENPYCISENLDLVSLLESQNFSNYIKEERDKFDKGLVTKSCLTDFCSSCSICNDLYKNNLSKVYSEDQIYDKLIEIEEQYLQRDNLISTESLNIFLLRFSKYDLFKFVGHLDFYRLFIRILRLGGINFEYSKGFNPTPKIFFPFTSSIGMESYSDIVIFICKNEIIDKEKFCNIYNNFLPEGFKFCSVMKIDSINEWRKNARMFQVLNIPFLISENSFNQNLFKQVHFNKNNSDYANNIAGLEISEIKNKIVEVLKSKDIEVENIEVNIQSDKGTAKNENIGILKGEVILKTIIKENQINIIKLLNNSNINIDFDIFSKREILN